MTVVSTARVSSPSSAANFDERARTAATAPLTSPAAAATSAASRSAP